MSKTFVGASLHEWFHFSFMLGLTRDLLPVVSDPEAKISPQSKMVAVGKTPSLYNRDKLVVGIPDWTNWVSSEDDINNWERNKKYGICIQTREVRAIDIDFEDPEWAERIEAAVVGVVGVLPVRVRPNSAKRLLAFRLAGEYPKEVIRYDDYLTGGIVELLMNGQQFIAAGTHPSGVKYEWRGGLPDVIPELTLAQLDAVKAAIAGVLGTEWNAGRPGVARAGLADVGRVDDAVSDWLRASEWFRGDDRDGRVYIFCPWMAGHSSDSGETETTYFPAGSNSLKTGGWKCLHASCAHRTGWDFEVATGVAVEGMEPETSPLPVAPLMRPLTSTGFSEKKAGEAVALPDPLDYLGEGNVVVGAHAIGETTTGTPPVPLHPLAVTTDGPALAPGVDEVAAAAAAIAAARWTPEADVYPVGVDYDTTRPLSTMPSPLQRKRTGEVKAIIGNVIKVISCEDLMGFRIMRDRFREDIVIGNHEHGWEPIKDGHLGKIRWTLEKRMFEPVGRELLRDAIKVLVHENSFDSGQRWLTRLVWDGVPRVREFMAQYLDADPTPYARAMSEYIWTGLAGRVMEPGCQLDMVPIWVSPQGTGKSSIVANMAPSRDLFVELDLNASETDLSRLLRGTVIGELAELKGLHTREMDRIKAWVTRRYEKLIQKYEEYATIFPRRLLMIGTTNEEQMLADPSGNRRWGPIKVGAGRPEAILRDREQLWAEGLAMWMNGGIRWEQFEMLAKGEHAQYMISDSWEDKILDWLKTPDGLSGSIPELRDYVTTQEIAAEALHIPVGMLKKADGHRIAAAMRAINYKYVTRRVKNRVARVWVPDVTYVRDVTQDEVDKLQDKLQDYT